MNRLHKRRGSSCLLAFGLLFVSACGSGENDTAPSRIAVLSAFPAELAPLADQAAITDTVMINGHVFRVGTLGGTPVMLGLTGIGLANATNTTRALLDGFEVAAIVVSAVAGSTLRIADVTVPTAWALKDGTTFAADQAMLSLAREIAKSGTVSLEHCTTVAPDSGDEPVCLPFNPAIVVGGVGRSDDPFPNIPTLCQPGAGDVLGCDINEVASGSAADRRAATAVSDVPVATDMETAAIAREATAHGVPFIAFRGVSDGAEDPLGLPGFPLQFGVYYRLAAHNAAAAAVAFVERLTGRPIS